MDVNPYAAPQVIDNEPQIRKTLAGWALTLDSLKLFLVGTVVSFLGVPIAFVAVAILYGLLQSLGVPLP